jgi:uncharacterized membrane protein YfcA
VTFLLVALVVGAGAVAQAVSGFGFALLTVPLLAVLLGPKTAVVTDNVVGIGLVSLMVLRTGTASNAEPWSSYRSRRSWRCRSGC